jgi:hypothetical protein
MGDHPSPRFSEEMRGKNLRIQGRGGAGLRQSGAIRIDPANKGSGGHGVLLV